MGNKKEKALPKGSSAMQITIQGVFKQTPSGLTFVNGYPIKTLKRKNISLEELYQCQQK